MTLPPFDEIIDTAMRVDRRECHHRRPRPETTRTGLVADRSLGDSLSCVKQCAISEQVEAERVGETKAPRGAKTDQVLAAIRQLPDEFSVAQLELRCPGVSRDMVRRVLRERQATGEVECKGRGPAAKWRKKG